MSSQGPSQRENESSGAGKDHRCEPGAVLIEKIVVTASIWTR
jgi:hypothetical protein